MIKLAGGTLYPANEQEFERFKKLKNDKFYIVDVKESHNYKVLQKIFEFFKFCTNHYFGDSEAYRDKEKMKFIKDKMSIFVGHYTQIFLRSGGFEIRPKSISYDQMTPEERSNYLDKLPNAAAKHIFNDCTDEATLNRLYSFF